MSENDDRMGQNYSNREKLTRIKAYLIVFGQKLTQVPQKGGLVATK